jgi:hypothetical protein
VCRRGTMTDKFDEVACALNNSNALPWSTNGNHCNDRFNFFSWVSVGLTERVHKRAGRKKILAKMTSFLQTFCPLSMTMKNAVVSSVKNLPSAMRALLMSDKKCVQMR